MHRNAAAIKPAAIFIPHLTCFGFQADNTLSTIKNNKIRFAFAEGTISCISDPERMKYIIK